MKTKRTFKEIRAAEQLARSEAAKADPLRHKYNGTKARATLSGLVFQLTFEEYSALVPADMICPVTGVTMTLENGWDQMQLDRRVPSDGYVVGNVCFISKRANTIKSNMVTSTLLRQVADWMDSFK